MYSILFQNNVKRAREEMKENLSLIGFVNVQTNHRSALTKEARLPVSVANS